MLIAWIAAVESSHADETTEASTRNESSTTHLVRRVSGCEEPRLVRHVSGRFLTCEIGFPRTAAAPDTLNERIKLAQAAPECHTVAVADGPGMDGVRPALCNDISGVHGLRLVSTADLPTRSVAVLRDGKGRAVATGTLIAPNLLVTAAHAVECDSRSDEIDSLRAAAFGHALLPTGQLTGIGVEAAFLLQVEANQRCSNNLTPKVLLSSPSFSLDYALIPIELGEVANGGRDDAATWCGSARHRMSQAQKSGGSPKKGGRSVTVGTEECGIPLMAIPSANVTPDIGANIRALGYTRNAFFPRGLTVLDGGKIVYPSTDKLRGTTVHYNLQTAPGFSGSPVFDRYGNWIAMHTTSLSTLDEDEVVSRRVLRKFSRPNGGTRLALIVADIAKRLPKAHALQYFPSGYIGGVQIKSMEKADQQ